MEPGSNIGLFQAEIKEHRADPCHESGIIIRAVPCLKAGNIEPKIVRVMKRGTLGLFEAMHAGRLGLYL